MNKTGEGILLWIVLGLVVILEIVGVMTSGIFKQEIGTSVGLVHLAWFAIAYCTVTGVSLLVRPKYCCFALLAVIGMWTAVVTGFGPILAVLFLLFSAWRFGRGLLNRVLTESALDEVLALLLGLGIYSSVQGLLVHVQVNYPVVIALLLGLPLLLRPRDAAEGARKVGKLFRSVAAPDRRSQMILAGVGFPFCANWLVALKPEASTDGLAMHLVIPTFVSFHHYWSFDFQHTIWALNPMAGDWSYTTVYLLGGEAATPLLNIALLLCIAAMIFLMVQHAQGSTAAAVLTALFLSTPLVQFVTGSLYVENFWAAMVVGAFITLWFFYNTGLTGYLFASAVLLGVAISAKFGALPYALPLALFAGLGLWKSRSANRWAAATVIALALCLAFAAQPYAYSFIKTSNPLFPVLNNIFPSPYFHSTWLLRDIRFERPLALNELYDLTFHTDHFIEGQPGTAGLQYLLLVPMTLVLLLRRRSVLGWMGLLCGLAGSLIILSQDSNLRYCYAAMPLLTIGFSDALAQHRASDRALYRTLMFICLPLAAINIYLLHTVNELHKDFWLNPFSSTQIAEYRDRFSPIRALTDYLNQHAPGEPAIFVGTNQIAGFYGKAFTDSAHNLNFAQKLDTATSVQQVLRLAQDNGIRYFISPKPEMNATFVPALAPFLRLFTDPQMTSGVFYLAKLKPEYEGAAGLDRANHVTVDDGLLSSQQAGDSSANTFEPIPAGKYDDLDPRIVYRGPWVHSSEYPQTFDGSFSYTNVIGATAELSFSGTQISLVFTRSYNEGTLGVQIDGTEEDYVDLYALQMQWQCERMWSGLKPGIHHLRIRVIPRKDPASEGFYANIDGVVVG